MIIKLEVLKLTIFTMDHTFFHVWHCHNIHGKSWISMDKWMLLRLQHLLGEVYGAHFPPDTGADCVFYKDGTAGWVDVCATFFPQRKLWSRVLNVKGKSIIMTKIHMIHCSHEIHETSKTSVEICRAKMVRKTLWQQAATEWWRRPWTWTAAWWFVLYRSL